MTTPSEKRPQLRCWEAHIDSKDTYTCMEVKDHAGAHKWVPDGDVSFSFAPSKGLPNAHAI